MATIIETVDAPGDTSTPYILTPGDTALGTVSYAQDADYFRVDLVAGQYYTFTLTGTGATPLGDPILTLRNQNYQLIQADDDGGPGRNSIIGYFAVQTTGTYYLDANGYYDISTATGSSGSYTLTFEVATPLAGNPLASIDWGTQVTPTAGVVYVYFAQNGETFGGETSTGWTAYEMQQAMLAFAQYSHVINVQFQSTGDSSLAQFHLVQNSNTSALGSFVPPGETDAGVAVFSDVGFGWSTAGLAQGGYGFDTLIHEIGHALGLAHPHDNGGTSTIMTDVEPDSPYGSFGAWNLNQGVFTAMSYNEAWPENPIHLGLPPFEEVGFGWVGTPMALDIAVLQQKYGANTSWHSGNDTYLLRPDPFGTSDDYYTSIWDTGGIDTIEYNEAGNVIIDLRSATLQYGPGGGGYISYSTGSGVGGFTIANGVVIENATVTSGAGATLIGNDAGNVLTIGYGSGANNNVVDGGNGIDTVSLANLIFGGATVNLSLTGTQTFDFLSDKLTVSNVENVIGSNLADYLTGNSQANRLDGGLGNDTLDGGTGNDTLIGGSGDDTYYADTYLDTVTEDAGAGNDTIVSTSSYILAANVENLTLAMGAGLIDGLGNAENNTITGNDSRNGITGGEGNDTIIGNGGDDAIDGGIGADSMVGGSGVDTYYVDNAGDQVVETEVGATLYDTVWTNLANYTLPANVEIYISIDGAGSVNGTGNDGTTLMLGNEGANILSSLGGNDIILGRDGNDTINSGAGGDPAGYEVISGGNGADLLTGGGGHDFFNYELISHGGDIITDFATHAGVEDDILDFRPMFPTFTNIAGITTVAQAVASGHLTYTQNGTSTEVYADANGGTHAPGEQVLMVTLYNTTAADVQTYTLI